MLPAASALPVGTQGRFVILLRDQTGGDARALPRDGGEADAGQLAQPAVKRIMMRVALLEMDEASRAVHRG